MLLATQVTRDTILDMGTGRKHFLSAEQFGIVSLSPSNNLGEDIPILLTRKLRPSWVTFPRS